MRYYELLYIVNPNLEDDRVKNIIDEIGNEVGKYKVSIINHYLWGKKRLAYPINNNKYGIYLLLQFSAEQFDFLKDFERFLILDKSVIRHQLVRLDEEPAKVEDVEPIIDDKDLLKDKDSKILNDDTKVDVKETKDTEDAEDAKDADDTVEEIKDEESTVEAENVNVEESEAKEEIKEEDQ